jgi:hypothetical protein
MRWREEFGMWQCRRTFTRRCLLDHPMMSGAGDLLNHDQGDEDRRPDFDVAPTSRLGDPDAVP